MLQAFLDSHTMKLDRNEADEIIGHHFHCRTCTCDDMAARSYVMHFPAPQMGLRDISLPAICTSSGLGVLNVSPLS